jgi:hypothetical protein
MAAALGLRSASNAAKASLAEPACSSLSGQHHAVLERAVHALAVERHHRVGGIAQQYRLAAEVPAVQVQRAKQARWMLLPVLAQARDQRQRVGEVAREQRLGLLAVAHR